MSDEAFAGRLGDLYEWAAEEPTQTDKPRHTEADFLVRQLRLRPDFDIAGWEWVAGKWRYRPIHRRDRTSS